ncbi:transmembrane 4 L6 family member 5 isoform X1 [Dicentrarchus labrax]|uniref:transmembrane 4 L6 family member 5 isoform X1 n=1 Tax=Dicentrarchus labrax TaxID=13489 RepID=UPI0021F65FCA|nr:transmembrane 4 L6 family member 5 isoform X1 [Dicentrarchus labrax]
MCVSRCLQCVGISLVPMATICLLANILLLLPELKVHFLLEGHVTREAKWATGLWGSGFLLLFGARAFVQSSKTSGCCAFRGQMLRQVLQMSLCVSRCCVRCYRCFSVYPDVASGATDVSLCIQMLRQVLYSCVCFLAAGICCLVSATGLSQGPLCLYNTTSGPTWGVPLQPLPDRHAGYLYNRTLWSGVCLEPRGVVQWNVVLFSVMGGASGLQTLFCGANILNSLLGLVLGQGFCHNKVSPASV